MKKLLALTFVLTIIGLASMAFTVQKEVKKQPKISEPDAWRILATVMNSTQTNYTYEFKVTPRTALNNSPENR